MAAADLREQRVSRWEQLWDDESGRLYFYFKVNSSDLPLYVVPTCSTIACGLNAAEIRRIEVRVSDAPEPYRSG